ncbi:ARM repeat-containing protein [Aulographum hederae CBS 113979]|uniref:ARM repeat-containing protein n=1 Tax=Aulographum hederae CBS 113979 TaxID=1176131 RepID=A0A6G1H8I5_9PEZI|nr:ARM repeat-containing protein [Aulographum hederae CBS 113979]
MEEQLVQLLAETQSSAEGPRKHAELQLKGLYTAPGFPVSLTSVASHDSVPLNIRQSALLVLKTFVQTGWSPQFEDFGGQILVNDEDKARLRHMLVELATANVEERKVKSAASYVVSKIASADFPEEWPDLLPTLLHIVQTGTDAQLHGALRVLVELVDDGFEQEQFFSVARDLVKTIYDVATSDTRKVTLRALAVSVFRACFDILETVMDGDHKAAVKQFADEALSGWVPFFIEVLKSRLPQPPLEEQETNDPHVAESYRGLIALKFQVVKVLMRIRSVFPSNIAPQSPVLFSATWDELSSFQETYHQMFIEDTKQSRLEDADGLPYTLDFLVLEELDFMQACLRAQPVRKELEQQLHASSGPEGNWITAVMKLAVAYAQITTEEEGMWNLDVNVFLSEETSVTANYTPRIACGDLVIKLSEWLRTPTIEGLLAYARSLYTTDQSWKAKEAVLFILNHLLTEFSEVDQTVEPEIANSYVDFIRYAMQQEDEFLRARGFLVAGSLTASSTDAMHQVAGSFMEATLQAITNDASEVVQVSCIRAIQHYSRSLPGNVMLPLQSNIIAALSSFLSGQDLQELAEGEDLVVTLVETLRDTIMLDTTICLSGAGLDLLFTLASQGASNFNLTMLVAETFEDISARISEKGDAAYVELCAKVLPSLVSVFDVGNIASESNLTNLAAELLSILTAHGREPLPNGFVATVMPKLNRLLLSSDDEELLKNATVAVKNMLSHDYKQLFEWRDEAGKAGLEVVLVIIDRLLGPSVDDNSASEVGGLAAEVVEKAGAERLGPYLMQLLSAVAIRLGSATKAQFIQSLILVFARLSLVSAREVVDFLDQVRVGSESGLQVVMSKWLENSINFSGYDEIRQNVIALSKLYELDDPRLRQVMVKGDLIIPASDRIMTRSRARQNPDQFTIVPANLKILKVLVEELLSASGGQYDPQKPLSATSSTFPLTPNPVLSANGSQPNLLSPLHNNHSTGSLNNDGEEEDGWEDDDDLDLTSGLTKSELMSFGEDRPGSGYRQRDDETQAYLVDFFRGASQKPGFEEVFMALTEDERGKLRAFGRHH